MDYRAHPKSIVESSAVGSGTRVWAFAHVMDGAVIGSDCNIGEHVFVEDGAVLGDRVTVKNCVQVWEGVTLEDDVFVGPAVVFTNDRNPRSARAEAVGKRYETKDWLEPVTVREGASIGANATVVCGVEIGRFAMVAAGSVVTKNVPDQALVMGVPAQVSGYVCRCGQRINEEDDGYTCGACGLRFASVDGLPQVGRD